MSWKPLLCGGLVAITLFSINVASARPKLFVLRAPGGGYCEPYNISADCQVISGTAYDKNGFNKAFRQAGRHDRKETLTSSPFGSGPIGLSEDGSVVLGYTYNSASLPRAFLWTRENGAVDLSADPDLDVYPAGLSGNGKVVVGRFNPPLSPPRPFYWTAQTGFQSLSISNYNDCYVGAVNHDGGVIVGGLRTVGGDNYAARWIGRGEPQLLDPLGRRSGADVVTPDGAAILGTVEVSDGIFRPFRWTVRDGMFILNSDSSSTFIGSVSADGWRFVGSETRDDGDHPILWTSEHGPSDLNDRFGTTLPRGWRFAFATAISADGRWIAGSLVHSDVYRGFLLDTGPPRKP